LETANTPCSANNRSAAVRIASWVVLARSLRAALAVVTRSVNAPIVVKSSD
jgi:hypothetical protein